MRATVADEKIEAVLDILMTQHPLLTSNHHDIARNFLAIALPEFTEVKEQPKTNAVKNVPETVVDKTIIPQTVIEQTTAEPETFTQGGLFEMATVQNPIAIEPTINELQKEYFEYTIEYVEEESSITAEDFQTWRKQAQEIVRSFKHLKQIDILQRQFETDSLPLSDRAQQVQEDDQQRWGEQVSAVIEQARHVLKSKGTPTSDGNLF